MKRVGKEIGVKGKALFFPVRGALTGSEHGPELAGVAAVRGRKGVLDLIARALELNKRSLGT
jgi:glutamyl/glutaminyl-tRNA synthetase